MRRNLWIILGIIIIITFLAGIVDWPNGPDISIGSFNKVLKIHQGLDLQGGVHLTYELDTSKIEDDDKSKASESVISVIDQRINALGVTEPVIQSAKISGKESVIVELPGITDVDEAKDLIGKTAQLKFLEENPEATKEEDMWKETELTGKHLKRAEVEFDQNTGDPQVGIQFNAEGSEVFEDVTVRNLQKPVAIKLDDLIISTPTVQTVIKDGNAVITGEFTIEEAKNLTIQLNAGALPVPIELTEQRTIGPTLGSESVKKSLTAGLIGIFLVACFMIIYYRLPGLLATIALLIYAFIVLALFKLIPITLTLAGIAGFILSIGMAVDANILIFERTKEELFLKKPISNAIDNGFKRAWASIRDSNVSSLITCLILYFGTTGIVRGFAVTLGIGILISMFTAITVSRTFLKLLVGTRFEKYLIIK